MKFAAFALFALVAVSVAWSEQERRSNAWKYDGPASLSTAKPFTAGHVYRFRYDSQISSGLGIMNSNYGSQQATHRLSAMVNVHFETGRTATLRLEDIRVGSLNGELREIRNVQPMQLFKEEGIDSDKLEDLTKPCKFELVDGLVERITFDAKDDTWSKNIKRAVLNLLQINLKQRNSLETSEMSQSSSQEKMTSMTRTFDVKEVTLEGECKVSYTVNKVSNDEDREVFNVTKTIAFNNCSELPTIYYGLRIQKPTYTSKVHELEEQQLDRSTSIRYQLIGSEDKYAVANVEILSQYVYKTLGDDAMQTVVAGRLIVDSIEKQSERTTVGHLDSKEETLVYSTEADRLETRFYQYGDEEFTRDNSPFAHVQNKVKMIQSMIRKLAASTEDKTYGLEADSALKLQQVVELFRMCTVHEIQQLFNEADSNEREFELLVDAAAIAGTRNTIHFLAERIHKNEITPAKAIVVLRQFSSLPAISEKQVNIVLRLCQHNVMQKSVALRQACWLTTGSMISEVCKRSVVDEDESKMCSRHQKAKYEQALWTQYTEADNQFDKVLAIKAIGNAALDLSVQNLESIIVNRRESSTIRIQAIDALRRLRNEMPRKIQRILLPVFSNTLENPEVRMIAFSMIMNTYPEKSVMDSIAYTLHRERSTHVRSFVLSCFKAYSASSIPEEREMASHLRSVLMMARIDLDGACRYSRIPIYSGDKQEGLFINWASIFSTSDALPKHMSASLDSFLNGLLEKDSVSITLTQNNIESFYHRIMEVFYGMTESNTRAHRTSRKGEEELDTIFDSLKIKTRDSLDKDSFGLITLRIRDVDQVILPLGEEYMPAILKALLNGERLSASHFDSSLLKGKRFRVASALSFHERSLKIATSSGMPLRVLHTLPVVAALDGEVKFEMKSSEKYLATIKVHPIVSAVHTRRMELSCPIFNTGVESLRSIALNLPIDLEVVITPYQQEKVKINFRVPEKSTRLVVLHSLPTTFVKEFDSEIKMHNKIHSKSIRNIVMEPRLIELHQRNAGPFVMMGHVHKPAAMTFTSIAQMLWGSENNFELSYDSEAATIERIQLIFAGEAFQRAESNSAKPRFEDFYENNKKFESIYDDDVEDMNELESHDDRRNRLNSYLKDEYKPRSSYRHMLRTSIQTYGGRYTHKASAEIKATCDSQMSYCKFEGELKRTPIFDEETREWTLTAESQILLPEYVRDVSELSRDSRRHNKLATTLKAEWGCEKTQKISLKLQGERAVPQKWIQRSGEEWRRVLATAFLNKYDLVADFQLSASVKHEMERYFDLLRLWNFWNVNSEDFEARSNEIHATLIIDPRTRQHFNISVRTPTERVRFTNVQMPMVVKPFALVRPQEQRREINSIEDAVTEYTDSRRAECRVDGRRIKTFDSVTYKAPIGNCWSVIAKDCTKKSFVVLMKSMDENTDAKALKIVTAKRTIEIEQLRSKLIVKIDGEKVEDVEELRNIDIDYSEDLIRCTLPQGVSIRFDGKQATIKMSHYYKNSQCGLCGHFDGEEDDEFRRSDNTLTDNVKDFHRSYSLLDDECDNNVYDKNTLFGMESRRKQSSRRDYNDEMDFENDDDVNDYEMFDRRESNSDYDAEKLTQEPVLKTLTIEHNHKICFSLRPIKECPRGSYAEETKEVKVQFGCLNRSTTQARRLLREAAHKDITSQLGDLKMSVTETVRSVVACA